MAMLEAQAQKIAEEETGVAKPAVGGTTIRFVRGASNVVESNVTENPEEIDIGEDEDNGDDDEGNEDGDFFCVKVFPPTFFTERMKQSRFF